MARPTQPASVVDGEASQLDHGHQPQVADEIISDSPQSDHDESQPTNRKKTFKSRKSILENEDNNPTFWGIDSINETTEWTKAQLANAIKQAQRLASHYIKVFDERTEMLTMIQTLETRVEVLDQDNHNFRGDIEDLERELMKKQGTIEYLETQQRQQQHSVTPLTENIHSTKGRARLEDPDKFSGKKDDLPDFETWKSNIDSKLRVDSRSFDNENHKIIYVYSRTSGDAQGHIRDRVDNDHFNTAKEVLQALEAVYGDPHKAIKAEAELQRLGQTLHGSFHSLYTDFIRIVRSLDYNDEKLKGVLVSKLNDKYLTAIGAFFDLPYNQLIEKLHAIDMRYESQRIARESRKQLTISQPPVSSGRPSDKTNTGQMTAPTTITAPRTDRTPVRTRAEYDALQQAGLCKKCCKPVHTALNERCAEKSWAITPPHIKAMAKDAKQVNNVEPREETAMTLYTPEPSKN
jgi:hypothetical protein